VAELVDALDSKSSLAQTEWGFESPLRHIKAREYIITYELFLQMSLYEKCDPIEKGINVILKLLLANYDNCNKLTSFTSLIFFTNNAFP
jgi:hypothetical protein